MLDWDTWQEVWATLRSNRFRAFLTALGVFWGVFILLSMLGVGKGLERGVIRNLSGMATYGVYVWPQRTSLPFQGLQPGRYVRLNDADITAVTRTPGVERVAPRLQLASWRGPQNVSYGPKTAPFNVMGDHPEFAYVEPLIVKAGRFINARDISGERKVVVLGLEAQKTLFGSADPLGKYVQIKRVYFQVVGVVATLRRGDDADRVHSTVYVPFSTFQTAFNQKDKVGWFALTARRDQSAAVVEERVRAAIMRGHRIDPHDAEALGSYNSAQKFEQMQGLFQGIRRFVWFVGTLTLLSGMLGVSNILRIIVKERTKEIGVRKALGATPSSITWLIVAEGMVLTTLAGSVGVVASVFGLEAIARAVSRMPNAPLEQPEISLQVALAAVSILVGAGVVAAIFPARLAARVQPIEALRAE